MRYCLILLFGLIPFLSPAQVLIKPETSHFFLEVHDSLQVYKRIEVKQDSIIQNLRKTLSTQQSVIETYKDDQKNFAKLLDNKNQEINNSNKEIKRQKRLKYLGYGIAIVVILLSL